MYKQDWTLCTIKKPLGMNGKRDSKECMLFECLDDDDDDDDPLNGW